MARAATIFSIIGMAVGLTLLQLGISIVGPADGNPTAAYGKLFAWDSVWYADIAEHGYAKRATPFKNHQARTMENWTEFSNGGFFPGYPVIASLIRHSTGTSIQLSLLLAAQLMCAVFWTYFLLLLRQLKIGRRWQYAAVALVFCYPTAFYLVSGYAESTFLAFALGFVFWSAVPRWQGFVLATVHGVLLTMTRIVGIPLVLYPLVRTPSALLRNGLLAAVSLCGAAGFCLLCAQVFGRWDFYLWVQQEGWGIVPHFAVAPAAVGHILVPLSLFPDILTDPLTPLSVNMLCTSAGLWTLIALAVTDAVRQRITRDGTWRVRLPFVACGAMIFFLYLAGLLGSNLTSMARYMLTIHVFLVLTMAHLFTTIRWKCPWATYAVLGMIGAMCILGLYVQRHLSGGFIAGGWVA